MTFKQAQQEILKKLKAEGWQTAESLKIPWAKPPGLNEKIWFKPQSLYRGKSRPELSLWIDPKKLAPFPSLEISGFLARKLGRSL